MGLGTGSVHCLGRFSFTDPSQTIDTPRDPAELVSRGIVGAIWQALKLCGGLDIGIDGSIHNHGVGNRGDAHIPLTDTCSLVSSFPRLTCFERSAGLDHRQAGDHFSLGMVEGESPSADLKGELLLGALQQSAAVGFALRPAAIFEAVSRGERFG